MEKRIPTLDEYIAESQQILEGKNLTGMQRNLQRHGTIMPVMTYIRPTI